MLWQLVGVLGASVVLGFAFNSSSPMGIRFSEPGSESKSSTALTTESFLPPLAATDKPTTVATPPPPVVVNPEVKLAPPTPTPSAPKVATRQLTPAAPVAPAAAAPTTTLVTPTTSATPQNPAAIHWTDAKPLAASGQAILVDVRAKAMYDAGHIPGAFSLPETSTPEEFTAFLNQHPTNLTLIVYCSSTSCSQSARVAGRLVNQFQRPSVKYMTGGYLEYQQAEMSKQPSPTAP